MKFYDERIQNHLLNGGKIKRSSEPFIIFFDGTGNLCYECSNYNISYTINKKDLLADDWEILNTEYNWNKIIKEKVLCIFNYIDNSNDLYGSYPILGYLIEYKYNEDYKFTGVMIDSCKANFKQCKPFNPKDFNIAKNLKEYKE